MKKNKMMFIKAWLLFCNQSTSSNQDWCCRRNSAGKNIISHWPLKPRRSALYQELCIRSMITINGGLKLKEIPKRALIVIGGGVIGMDLFGLWPFMGAKVFG